MSNLVVYRTEVNSIFQLFSNHENDITKYVPADVSYRSCGAADKELSDAVSIRSAHVRDVQEFEGSEFD